jgi:hypothetical protein
VIGFGDDTTGGLGFGGLLDVWRIADPGSSPAIGTVVSG